MSDSTAGQALDASPLIFGDIRFVRDKICEALDVSGSIKGFEQLLDIVVTELEADVAIARAQGKGTVMNGRLTLSAAIDRAEHLRTIRGMF